MTVFLNQIFKKTDEQDWSGVKINVERSISSSPDPRDTYTLDPDVEQQIKQKLPKSVSANGYSGWNREYKSDNELVVSYYFDTASNALLYFNNRSLLYSNSEISTMRTNNNPKIYDVEWEIVENGVATELNK